MVLRKSFYIRWSAGRSPRVHEVNPGRDPSILSIQIINSFYRSIKSNLLKTLEDKIKSRLII